MRSWKKKWVIRWDILLLFRLFHEIQVFRRWVRNFFQENGGKAKNISKSHYHFFQLLIKSNRVSNHVPLFVYHTDPKKLWFLSKLKCKEKEKQNIPTPRCAFILAYLAVPAKFLFSLQFHDRKCWRSPKT